MIKKSALFLAISFILIFCTTSSAELNEYSFQQMNHNYRYVEDFYGLYVQSLTNTTDDMIMRLYYLHQSSLAPFDHPVRSFAPIHSVQEYEYYAYLMYFRIAFLLTKTYVEFGAHFDLDNLYWYSSGYYPDIEKSFIVARSAYERAWQYWQKAKFLAVQCWNRRQFNLEGGFIDAIENEVYMVINAVNYTDMNWENINDYGRERYLDYDYDAVIANMLTELNEKWDLLQQYKEQYRDFFERLYPDAEENVIEWTPWTPDDPTAFVDVLDEQFAQKIEEIEAEYQLQFQN